MRNERVKGLVLIGFLSGMLLADEAVSQNCQAVVESGVWEMQATTMFVGSLKGSAVTPLGGGTMLFDVRDSDCGQLIVAKGGGTFVIEFVPYNGTAFNQFFQNKPQMYMASKLPKIMSQPSEGMFWMLMIVSPTVMRSIHGFPAPSAAMGPGPVPPHWQAHLWEYRDSVMRIK